MSRHIENRSFGEEIMSNVALRLCFVVIGYVSIFLLNNFNSTISVDINLFYSFLRVLPDISFSMTAVLFLGMLFDNFKLKEFLTHLKYLLNVKTSLSLNIFLVANLLFTVYFTALAGKLSSGLLSLVPFYFLIKHSAYLKEEKLRIFNENNIDLLWCDLETSGLDPKKDQILEFVVLKAKLNNPYKWEKMYGKVLYHDCENLDEFIEKMHTNNGLLAECLGSTNLIKDIEKDLLELITANNKDKMPILAGSSIHFDHAFINEWMPEVGKRLSHRHFDVSSIKLFCQSQGMKKFPKAEAHRAYEDILESIDHSKKCLEFLKNS